MTPNSPYELVAPSKWAQPPSQFSFSSLQAIAVCPRRWQLLRSEWGTYRRFPERAYPSAVEGQIVHEGLDRLSRALGRVGRPPLGSPEFQAAALDCGFWTFFAKEIDERNARAVGHPRTGPGFMIRTLPRELANRAVRLFREQYRPSDRPGLTILSDIPFKPVGGPGGNAVRTLLQRKGVLSEVQLEHPSLPLAGVLDLVSLEEGSAVTIVDYKTGARKDSHKDQLLLYAVLWWRVTGLPPVRIEVQYLNDVWKESVSESDLERMERQIETEIGKASAMLTQQPAPARASPECARCPVRARCDDGWLYAEPRGVLAGRTADCEITVTSPPIPTGFTARRRDGREVQVVHNVAVGTTLPTLGPGTRLRLLDAVPADDGKTLEIRAWSECYLI